MVRTHQNKRGPGAVFLQAAGAFSLTGALVAPFNALHLGDRQFWEVHEPKINDNDMQRAVFRSHKASTQKFHHQKDLGNNFFFFGGGLTFVWFVVGGGHMEVQCILLIHLYILYMMDPFSTVGKRCQSHWNIGRTSPVFLLGRQCNDNSCSSATLRDAGGVGRLVSSGGVMNSRPNR